MGSIAYHFDADRKLVRARAEGALTASDLLVYVRSIVEDPAILPGFIEVVDMEPVEDLVLSYSQLPPFRAVWRKYLDKGVRTTLIYAPGDVSYGICRMIQAVVDPDGEQPGIPFIIVSNREELGTELGRLGVIGPVLSGSELENREQS